MSITRDRLGLALLGVLIGLVLIDVPWLGVDAWAFVAPDIEAGRLMAPFGFVSRPSCFAFLRPERREDRAVAVFADWLVEAGRRSPAPPTPSTGPAG